ncbi:hypothetical protein [Alistipes sp. D31t1_170403_E11]|uniref:hypothetical protein n=1 Tax=Alistipes sp. D31t1_170403_E11 TaxID=2787128 RepID=UPI00189ADC71|nr:hypothetical protein [Alistipes sp. D31t1_170403_E11]
MNTKPILRCAAALAALAVLACSKDDTAEPGTPDTSGSTTPFTITATMDDAPETRVSASDDGANKIELKWQRNDKIYVVNSAETGTTSAGTLYKFTAQSISTDGKTASFTAPAGYEGMPAYAAYAGTLSSFFNPASIGIGIGAYRTSASGLPEIYPLYAAYDAETRQLKFKPLFAVLKLNVTLPEGASGVLSRLRIGSEDGSEIFYYGSYDITSGEAVRKSSSVANKIIQSGSSPFTGNTEQSVYLSVNPGTELTGKELEIDLIVGTSVYTATVKGAKLEAGKCYPLTLGTAKWTARKIYEGGTGAQNDPYRITTETNLRALARTVRTGETYKGKYFLLTGDISGIQTSEAEPWLPIGTGESFFGGNFDGGNHTVGGTFQFSDKDGTSLGLFGYCSGGSISNLTLAGDVAYSGTQTATVRLGGIAGYCEGTITGCTHTGALTATNAQANTIYAGGIAGYYSGTIITGCTQQNGNILVNAGNSTRVGGIVGYMYKSSSAMHTCHNSASSIVATGQYTVNAGALVGSNNGTVYSCSTFTGLTITEKGTQQNPVRAIGYGYPGQDVTQPCPDGHTD